MVCDPKKILSPLQVGGTITSNGNVNGLPASPANAAAAMDYILRVGIGSPATRAEITVSINSLGTTAFAFIDLDTTAGGIGDLFTQSGTTTITRFRLWGGGGNSFTQQAGIRLRVSADPSPSAATTVANLIDGIVNQFNMIPVTGSGATQTTGTFVYSRNYAASRSGDTIVFSRITTGPIANFPTWRILLESDWTTAPTLTSANGVAEVVGSNTWEEAEENPGMFVKSTSIAMDQKSVTFTDQANAQTTFTPPEPAAYVKSTNIAGDQRSVTFTDQADATTTFTPADPPAFLKSVSQTPGISLTLINQNDGSLTFTPTPPPTKFIVEGVISNAGNTLTLTNADTGVPTVFTPSGSGGGYENVFANTPDLLTKVALFLGVEGTTVTNANNQLTYTPYTTDGTTYFFFPNRDNGKGQWSNNSNPVAAGAVTWNLIG